MTRVGQKARWMDARRCMCALLISAGMLFGLSACVGGKIPSEQILRIAQQESVTPDSGGMSGTTRHFGGPVILMENMASFPGLDRSAVMLAKGNVLTPSSRWYWEASPGSIASARIASHLQTLPEFTLVWPMRNRQEHQAVLTGRVESFEVRERESVMVICLRMSLWTERGKLLLLSRSLDVHEPLDGMNPQSIAEAASKGMQSASEAIGEWLRTEGLQAIASQQ